MVSASTDSAKTKNTARLYVGKLNPSITQLTLKSFFSKYGDVLQVDKPGDNFGFVQFKKVEDAHACLNKLGNAVVIAGVSVVVQQSQSSANLQQRRGPGPGATPSGAGFMSSSASGGGGSMSSRLGSGQKYSSGWRAGEFDSKLLARAAAEGPAAVAASSAFSSRSRYAADDWKEPYSSLRSSLSLDRDLDRFGLSSSSGGGGGSGSGLGRFSSLLGPSPSDFGYDRIKGPDNYGESSFGSLSSSRYAEPSRDSFGLSRSSSSFAPPTGVIQDLQELKSSIQMLMKENARLRTEKQEIQMEAELSQREAENDLLQKLHRLQQENEDYHGRLSKFEEDHLALRETLQMANDSLGRTTDADNFSSFSPELQERLLMLDTMRQNAQPTEKPNWQALKTMVTDSLEHDQLSLAARMNLEDPSGNPFGVHTRLGAGAAGLQQRLGGRVKLPGGAGRQMGNQNAGPKRGQM